MNDQQHTKRVHFQRNSIAVMLCKMRTSRNPCLVAHVSHRTPVLLPSCLHAYWWHVLRMLSGRSPRIWCNTTTHMGDGLMEVTTNNNKDVLVYVTHTMQSKTLSVVKELSSEADLPVVIINGNPSSLCCVMQVVYVEPQGDVHFNYCLSNASSEDGTTDICLETIPTGEKDANMLQLPSIQAMGIRQWYRKGYYVLATGVNPTEQWDSLVDTRRTQDVNKKARPEY